MAPAACAYPFLGLAQLWVAAAGRPLAPRRACAPLAARREPRRPSAQARGALVVLSEARGMQQGL
jgi:hypothetical protein